MEWAGTGWGEAWTGAWEVETWPARVDLTLAVEAPAGVSPHGLLQQGRATTALTETETGTGRLTGTSCPLIGQEIGVLIGLRLPQGWAAILMDLRQETRMAPLVMEGGTEALIVDGTPCWTLTTVCTQGETQWLIETLVSRRTLWE